MSSFSTADLPTASRQSLSLSRGGMLLCIFACTLALLNVSRDRTGSKTGEVRRAFEASLQTNGQWSDYSKDESSRESIRSILTVDLNTSGNPGTATSGTQNTGVPEMARMRRRTLEIPPDASISDPRRAAFVSLLNELNRFCKLSPVNQYAGELAFDFLSLEATSEAHLVGEASETVRLIRAETPTAVWEFEVIIWAHSPTEESLSAAVLKSWRVQQALQGRMKTDSTKTPVTSSGRIWLQSDDLRPVLTLVARRRLGLYPVAQKSAQL